MSDLPQAVLGSDLDTALSVLQQLPTIQQTVADLKANGAKEIDNKVLLALDGIEAVLTQASNRVNAHSEMLEKALNEKTGMTLDAARQTLQDEARDLQKQIGAWVNNYQSRFQLSSQPVIDATSAQIAQDAQTALTAFSKQLSDSISQYKGTISNAADEQVKAIQAAQSTIQVLSFQATTDDITKAPTPSVTSAPALLFYSLGTVFRVYAWNTGSNSWGSPLAQLTQPANGLQGNTGPQGNSLLTATWTGTVPTITRSDGSAVLKGDSLVNASTGDFFVYDGTNWNQIGNLKGPQGDSAVPVDLSTFARKNDLVSEVQRAQAVEATLATNAALQAEIQRAQGVELTMAKDSALQLEVSRAKTAESNLAPMSALTAEIQRAEGVEATLATNTALQGEVSRATSAETAISNNLAAIQQSLANSIAGMPIGVLIFWPNSVIPSNAMIAQGQSFSSSTNPQLAVMYPSLKLPDTRGMFVRGYDPTGSVDRDGATRGLLSFQEGTRVLADYGGQVTGFYQQGNYSPSAPNSLVNLGYDPRQNPGFTYYYATSSSGQLPTSNSFQNSNNTYDMVGITRPKNLSFNFIVRVV